MTIKPKWKAFAIRSSFSNEMTDAEAITLYDELSAIEDSEAAERYFRSHNEIVKWHPYEFMNDSEFVEQVEALARYAQDIEGTPDVYVVVRKGCVSYVSSTEGITATVVDTDGHHYDDEDGMQKETLKTAESLVRYW